MAYFACDVDLAVLIWRQGDYIGAVLALLWLLAGMMPIGSLLSTIHSFLGPFVPRLSAERTIHVGPIQNRFMNALGYARTEDPIREVR